MAGDPVSQGLLCSVFYPCLSGNGQFSVPSGDSLGPGEFRRHSAIAGGVTGAECAGITRGNDLWLAQAGWDVSEDTADCGSVVCVFPADVAFVERAAGIG